MWMCPRREASGSSNEDSLQSNKMTFPDGSWPDPVLGSSLVCLQADIIPRPLGGGQALTSPLPWEHLPHPKLGDECGGGGGRQLYWTSPTPQAPGSVGRTQKKVLSWNQRFLGQVLDAVTTPLLVPTCPPPCRRVGTMCWPPVAADAMSLCNHPRPSCKLMGLALSQLCR